MKAQAQAQAVNSLFIDVDNKTDANKVFRRLKKLKNVLNISKPENYYFDGIQPECIIRLKTHMSEFELATYISIICLILGAGPIRAH